MADHPSEARGTNRQLRTNTATRFAIIECATLYLQSAKSISAPDCPTTQFITLENNDNALVASANRAVLQHILAEDFKPAEGS